MKAGEKQELQIVKETGFGVYLAESKDSKERVLLPKKRWRKAERSEMFWRYFCILTQVTA